MYSKQSWRSRNSFIKTLTLVAGLSVAASSSQAAFNADLQAQSFGSTNWMSGHITGWAELDLIPARITVAGGPASNQTVTVNFPHAGIQNLYSFTPSANVQITSGPTLSAPTSGDWSYSFKVKLTDNQPGSVDFRIRLTAGAHRFTGSSLQVDGSPGLSKLFIFKPAAKAGAPDLAIVKHGPASANPGSLIAYSLDYSNRVSGTTATGVQITDTLPASVSFVDCAGGCEALGNTITWDLGDVARGTHGTITYRVAVTNSIVPGSSFQNNAVIEEAENDANYADNSSSVTTVVSTNCISPSILMGPVSKSSCGEAVTFSVLVNGSLPMSYQWRRNSANLTGENGSSLTTTLAGSYDVVTSNQCGSVTSTAVTLTVGNPVITSQPSDFVACAGSSAAFVVEATGDSLAYQWRKNGDNISGANSSLYEIPVVSTEDTGAYDVVVTGLCGAPAVSSPASLIVKSVPVAVDDDYSVNEDAALNGNVFDNDTDADGDTLSVVLESGPAHGDLILNTDGSFTYTPNPLFHGADSFTYRAVDDCGNSEVATVSITVNHVNHAPLAQDDSYNTSEDVALIVPAAGVLANDSDVDGDALEAVLVDGPSHGVVTLNANGSFTYTPMTGFFGMDSFTYQASDGLAESTVATVTLAVAHVNHTPVAVDDTLTIAENSGAHTIDALANDSDPDGDTLTISEVTQPANGVSAIVAGGVSYTPNTNFHGEDSFAYTIDDGNGLTATATVTVTVEHVAVAPVAQDDSYQVEEDDVLEVAASGILGNDINLEPTALTAILVAGPAHGSLTLHADGSFTYMPADNYHGADSFTYKANNAIYDSNVATVHINVLSVIGAGDIDLYVKTAKAKLSWSADDRDALAIRGQVNPRGIKDSLGGATMGVKINNIDVIPVQTLDARGVASSAAGALKIKCQLKTKNGAYSVRVSGANLREALGLENLTQAGMTVFTLRLTINGADLEVPVTTAQLEAPFKSTAGKSSALKFNFRKNRTLSGAFNCNKTAGSASSKGQTIKIKGAIVSEDGEPVVPNDDITIHVGNVQMTVPFNAMTGQGTGNTSAFQYKSPGMSVGLANATHSFSLAVATDDLGLPAAGAGNGMKYDLPLMIKVPTAEGMMVFESIIELKRSSESSTHWKR